MSRIHPVKKQQSLTQFFTRKSFVGDGATHDNDDSSSKIDLSRHTQADKPSQKRKRDHALGDSLEPHKEHAVSFEPSLLQLKFGHRRQPAFESSEDGQQTETSAPIDPAAIKAHAAFVKKLAGPNTLMNSTWRQEPTKDLSEPSEGDTEDEHQLEHLSHPRVHVKASTKIKQGSRTGTSLTPLEKQILDIKHENMDTILAVEVGYKVRFFGEDARIAARELGLVCIPGKFRFDEHISESHLDRLASASIPVHRLQVHVKRLVSAGFKVGIVRQIETAALKAVGNNRNTPFERKLTSLYTRSTYIDDVEDPDTEFMDLNPSRSGFILCIAENRSRNWGPDERVNISIVAVQPLTGDILYDDFEDGFMRSELGTRLYHIDPSELVVIGDLSKQSQNTIYNIGSGEVRESTSRLRIENVPRTKELETFAFSRVVQFFNRQKENVSGNDAQILHDDLELLSDLSVVCLSVMIEHLKAYGLEHVCALTRYFRKFESSTHMLLNGATLNNLEILQSQNDGHALGTLLWALDRTQTSFGRRMLRSWVSRPLLDRTLLEARFNAIEKLCADTVKFEADCLLETLKSVKIDLEKALIRVFYGRSTRKEVATMLQAFRDIALSLKDLRSEVFAIEHLIRDINIFPSLIPQIEASLEKINDSSTAKDIEEDFFGMEHESETVKTLKERLRGIHDRFEEHRKALPHILGRKQIEFVTVSGLDFLVEIENQDLIKVPANWIKISGTKKHSRFHTPQVIELMGERDRAKELLASACEQDFQIYLKEISRDYSSYRDAILSLARLDCLLSLALVARQPGYVRPTFNEDGVLDIQGGRHPVVERIKLESYISNDTFLNAEARGLLLTGPNMGGKSSYVRQVALIVIMAQIGSFVPASSATLCVVDGVYTRMGALDNIMDQKSTFMVELQETADILKRATSKSLVILDELGRGTSTHDGIAIARAVLDHISDEIRCFVLFITHYQDLAEDVAKLSNGAIRNAHMGFILDSKSEDLGQSALTFLYALTPGTAHRSYGLNVACMASLPEEIISTAKYQSFGLERSLASRSLAQYCANLLST